MSLKDRSRGYEFGEFEKEFIFHRGNTGFVEHVSEGGRLFSLNPSPFFVSNKNLHYYSESCDPPPNHACIEVEVFDEHIAHLQTRHGWQKDILKKISSWKPFDYQRLLQRKNLVDYNQIINFFFT